MNPLINSPAEFARTLLIITPTAENTIEKPRTKNTEFKIIFVLLTDNVLVLLFWLISVTVVPDMYAKNAGIIGNIQGATNDPKPAKAAMARVTSGISKFHNFFIKGFFQIFIHFPIRFYLGVYGIVIMNKRFIIVGIILGSIITIAFFVGSPMYGGFDMMR